MFSAIIGIEAVDETVLVGNYEQVVGDAGNGHSGNVERLRVDHSQNRHREQLAESTGVYVRQGELGFGVVESIAGVVVVVGEHVLGVG
jgi:hypothetical protein